MKRIVLTSLLILIAIGLLLAIVLGSKNNKTKENEASKAQNVSTLYYGATCPHCAEVEKWIAENKIEEKINIIQKEVYNNKENSSELVQAAESCGLPSDRIGVPLLYTPDGKCLIGSVSVIDYLRLKAGLTPENQATDSGKEKNQ